jgi:hypothetical protein
LPGAAWGSLHHFINKRRSRSVPCNSLPVNMNPRPFSGLQARMLDTASGFDYWQSFPCCPLNLQIVLSRAACFQGAVEVKIKRLWKKEGETCSLCVCVFGVVTQASTYLMQIYLVTRYCSLLPLLVS